MKKQSHQCHQSSSANREDAIILGTKLNYDELIQAGYSCADLNKTESVYVKGEKYRDMIEEYAGLSFAGAGQEAEVTVQHKLVGKQFFLCLALFVS